MDPEGARSLTRLQLLKASGSMDITVSGTETEIRFSHPSKASFLISSIPSGSMIFSRLSQRAKARKGILLIPEDRETDFRLAQEPKTWEPMDSTESGMRISSRERQPSKAESPI